jgi:hypothetical protein
LIESRRTYAATTLAAATGAAAGSAGAKAVKKAVKKTPTTKTKTTKTTAVKKKSPRKKGAAPKKKAVKKAKKKVVPKKKAKPLTEAQLEKKKAKDARATIKELREKALKTPPTGQNTAWTVFMGENRKGSSSVTPSLRELADRFKNLSSAEREHYNHLANERNATEKAGYKAWIESHTPDQIRIANNARRALRKKLAATRKFTPPHLQPIRDERIPKQPANPRFLFLKDRVGSGDFKGIHMIEAAKLIAEEYKALSAAEKQKYVDQYAADKEAYEAERKSVLGH